MTENAMSLLTVKELNMIGKVLTLIFPHFQYDYILMGISQKAVSG